MSGPGDWIPVSTDQSASDGLTVVSGVSGIHAQLDDIDVASKAIALAGARVSELALPVALGCAAAQPVVAAGMVVATDAAIHAETSLATISVGPQSVLVCAARLAALAGLLKAAVAGYRATETTVQTAIETSAQSLARTLGFVAAPVLTVVSGAVIADQVVNGGRGTRAVAHGFGRWGPTRSQGQELVRNAPVTQTMLHLAPSFLNGAMGSSPIMTAGWLLGTHSLPVKTSVRDFAYHLSGLHVAGAPLRDSGAVATTLTAGRTSTGPHSIGDIVADTTAGCPGGVRADGTKSEVSTVRVQKIANPQGNAWVVTVPGTSDWSVKAGANPFDTTTNVSAVGGRPNAVSRLVVDAMRQSHVPPGEPVLISGYSQGGLIAMQVADESVRSGEFNVTTVMTQGSPVGGMPLPHSVQVLSMEHGNDAITMLDGESNQDRANWTTVQRLVLDTGGGISGDPAANHHGPAYVDTAHLIDVSTDPALEHWRAEVRPFLANSNAPVTVWDATGVRAGFRP